jgi:hypothetical protein
LLWKSVGSKAAEIAMGIAGNKDHVFHPSSSEQSLGL